MKRYNFNNSEISIKESFSYTSLCHSQFSWESREEDSHTSGNGKKDVEMVDNDRIIKVTLIN